MKWMRSAQRRQGHVQLPPESFYWALLDVAALPARLRRSPQHLGYMFEALLPVDAESLHCVYLELHEQTVLACGMDRAVLITHQRNGDVQVLGPVALPPFIQHHWPQLNATAINMLTGTCEPVRVQRCRRAALVAHGLLIALCALILTFGCWRREQHLQQASSAWHRAGDDLVGAVMDHGHASSNRRAGEWELQPGLPAAWQLLAERRRLEQTHGRAVRDLQPVDVSLPLADLLAQWPAGLHAEIESITMAADRLTVRGAAPAIGDVQSLAESLSANPAWSAAQPQASLANEKAVFTMQIQRTIDPRKEAAHETDS